MKLSEGRKSYLSHRILEVWRSQGLAEIRSERHALAAIKRAMDGQAEMDTHIDEVVRRRIDSLSRQVPAGSREWDVLYRKYYDEEFRKLMRRPA